MFKVELSEVLCEDFPLLDETLIFKILSDSDEIEELFKRSVSFDDLLSLVELISSVAISGISMFCSFFLGSTFAFREGFLLGLDVIAALEACNFLLVSSFFFLANANLSECAWIA